ncbi:MAG: hypothetical protein HYR56_25740 [Acidobacteria bacterium]|nr:hypothetical protein [Acidobacteriota bacterium]
MMNAAQHNPSKHSARLGPQAGWLASWLVAMTVTAAAQHLPIKSYTTSDGLAHNTVNRIVKDSRGFLWSCTEDGLSRFDGYSFTNYSMEQGLPHRVVRDFVETRSGEFWLATHGGLVRFNPQGTPVNRVINANEAITPAPMFTVVFPEDSDRLARATIVLLESRDGTLWCGTAKALYRLERHNGRYELVNSSPLAGGGRKEMEVFDLLEDRRGALRVGTNDRGLFRRLPDGRMQHFTERDGLPDRNINDLFEDHQG